MIAPDNAPLTILSSREASIFACVVDTLMAPEDPLPAVHKTSTVVALDQWLQVSPSLNRWAIRSALYLVEAAPRVIGRGGRLRQLNRSARLELVSDLESAGPIAARRLIALLRALAAITYYSDDLIAMQLGYGADIRLARGRELRAAESRP